MEQNHNSDKKKKLLVVGSSNTDMVIKTSRFPKPGETIIGGKFFTSPGGKGANQAVSAARLGVPVSFVCKVGNDMFGIQAKQLYENEGIDTSFLQVDEQLPSGVALITIDANAENNIVVAPGSNANLLPADISNIQTAIHNSEIILVQLEIPMETVEFVVCEGARFGKKIILNPAPAAKLSESILDKLYLITPNKTETELLTGIPISDIESAKNAAKELLKTGVRNVVLTLGSQGALICNAEGCEHIQVPKVEAVDTTAAGDIFNGALSAALIEGQELVDSVRFACKVAAISVTRQGAITSAPYLNELK